MTKVVHGLVSGLILSATFGTCLIAIAAVVTAIGARKCESGNAGGQPRGPRGDAGSTGSAGITDECVLKRRAPRVACGSSLASFRELRITGSRYGETLNSPHQPCRD
jgi:hypothetical protein